MNNSLKYQQPFNEQIFINTCSLFVKDTLQMSTLSVIIINSLLLIQSEKQVTIHSMLFLHNILHQCHHKLEKYSTSNSHLKNIKEWNESITLMQLPHLYVQYRKYLFNIVTDNSKNL